MTGIPIESVDSATRAAQAIRGYGARTVVMKLGALGSVSVGDDVVYAPPFRVETVDTVAAGDAFTAALAMGWGALPVAQALRFANAAGAMACTKVGAQDAVPALSEVEALLQKKGTSA